MNTVFTETQKFNAWWHYLLAGVPVLIVIVIACLVQFDVMATKDGKKSPILFLAIILVVAAFFIWFMLLKLNTRIDKDGISVNFSGLPFCKKAITWGDIQAVSVIKYNPLSDYGGWGVRYSLTGNGWCYNVSGEYGIKLITTDGKPFLIGTQQKEEAEKIINLYFKK